MWYEVGAGAGASDVVLVVCESTGINSLLCGLSGGCGWVTVVVIGESLAMGTLATGCDRFFIAFDAFTIFDFRLVWRILVLVGILLAAFGVPTGRM